MPSLGFGEMVTKCEGVNVLVCMCVHVCMHARTHMLCVCDVYPYMSQLQTIQGKEGEDGK